MKIIVTNTNPIFALMAVLSALPALNAVQFNAA